AIAARRVAGLVDPTSRSQSAEDGFFGSEQVAETVAGDAGLRLPGLGALLGFLGVYVVIVGPLTAVVLRRRRRPELAWVVVPALAVVFTGVAYATGSGTRNETRLAHGTVVEVEAGSSAAVSYVGVSRPGSGTASLSFPEGWTVRRTGDRRPPDVVASPGGPVAELPLAVGEFGLVKASGPVEVPGGGLELTAVADDGEKAHGTVRNLMPQAVEEVAVFAGRGVAFVGRLGPGEERRWEVGPPGANRNLGDAGGGGFGPGIGWFERSPGDWWPSSGDDATGRDGVVNLALWQETRVALGPEARAPGTATAVAWTRAWRPEFGLDGRTRSLPGRTAVVVRAPIGAAAGTVPPLSVRREVVRGPYPNDFGGFGGDDFGGDDSTVVRFALPDGAGAGTPLALFSSARLGSVEVWHDGAWKTLAGAGGAGAPAILPFPPPAPAPPSGPTPTTAPPPPPPPGPPGPPGPTATTLAVPRTIPMAPAPVPVPPPSFPDDLPFDGGPGVDASTGIAIPAGAARDGVIFVRVRIVDFDPNLTLTLGEAS
ncbi:MAG: hypothetical protein ACRDY7_08975, partial [Acidimicrobiia bacterium]